MVRASTQSVVTLTAEATECHSESRDESFGGHEAYARSLIAITDVPPVAQQHGLLD